MTESKRNGAQLVFREDGSVRGDWAWVLVIVLAGLGATPSDLGFLDYAGEDILALIVPIAGVFLALALPAAQLAQSVKERLLESAEALLKAKPDKIEKVKSVLERLVAEHRRNLESMKRVIYYSLASLMVGLLGIFGAFKSLELFQGFIVIDFFACLATLFLIMAVLWLLPVVRSSVELREIDKLLGMLKAEAIEVSESSGASSL